MEERKKRLAHLVKSYKSDFDSLWEAYTALCKENKETPAKLLTDPSLYDDEEGVITVSTLGPTTFFRTKLFYTFRHKRLQPFFRIIAESIYQEMCYV